jgi:tRNA (guanine-N7-)-methyltransferase
MVERLPPASAAAFHAYFLDPWPKKKQRKRRLLGEHFLAAAAAAGRSGALFRIVTDHADYAAAIAEAIAAAGSRGAPWRETGWSSAPAPPPTNYEIKYRAAGRPLHRFLLIRN